jgi:hypothetical protein
MFVVTWGVLIVPRRRAAEALRAQTGLLKSPAQKATVSWSFRFPPSMRCFVSNSKN